MTPTTTPAPFADVVFDHVDRSLCDYEPRWLTVEGTVTLSPANRTARLQTSWYIVHPEDLRTETVYQDHGIVQNGHRFSVQVYWPGIRPGDSVVEDQGLDAVAHLGQARFGIFRKR